MAVLPIGMSGEAGGYQIERSLRFNSADSTYLSRTPPSASNRKTWTWGGWVKRSELSTLQWLFTAGTTSTSRTYIGISASDNLFVGSESSTVILDIVTSQVFRDPSSWYHIVISIDTTQATAANRVRVYVNGTQVTSFSTASYPSQNTDLVGVNTTDGHYIGVRGPGGLNNYFGGYLTDINFIDGQALTPSSFGETDSDTGVWKPKAYTGSYGTNGFYLKFADNSGTTSTTLGKDSSPNGNNWTPNNFSVTAGAGNDSLVDTPTPYGTDTGAGGEVRGNYATWNPLRNDQSAVLTNGNLDLSTAGSGDRYGAYTTLGVSSGKWYWEITAGSLSTDGYNIGITSASKSPTSALGSDAESYIYLNTANKRTSATTVAYGATYTAGDVIGVALDLDVGTLTFYKNGTSQGTAYTSIPSNTWFPTVADNDTGSTTGSSFIGNFGQRPFAYTAPSGFKALCTQNLPEPTVVQGDDYFNTVLWTGNDASPRTITGVGFQPDFVWIKPRSLAQSHHIFDAVRGTQVELRSNTTDAELTSTYGNLTAYASDGFTLTAGVNGIANVNANNETFVAWNWKANGSGVTNTAGSITSTVSANTTSGFSIVTWTGTGANATVGHGLGVAPKMIIVKNRTTATSTGWIVYHSTLGGTQFLVLNSTTGAGTVSTVWNDTATTSSVFSLGSNSDVNQNTNSMVAYCFAPVSGFSAMGAYTGSGSADGPFIYTGFRPAFVMIKQSSAAGEHWVILDNDRNTSNVENKELYANLSNAESSNAGNATLDFVSNGFKIRTTNAGQNTSSATYIYACFAESPFRYSLAR